MGWSFRYKKVPLTLHVKKEKMFKVNSCYIKSLSTSRVCSYSLGTEISFSPSLHTPRFTVSDRGRRGGGTQTGSSRPPTPGFFFLPLSVHRCWWSEVLPPLQVSRCVVKFTPRDSEGYRVEETSQLSVRLPNSTS